MSALARAHSVFHIAGLFNHAESLERLFEVNVLGTRNLLRAIERCHRLDVLKYPRVVVWGAAGVFGNFLHIPLPATEEMPPQTNNPYLLSKLYEELEALQFCKYNEIPITVIRPSAVYGSRSVYGMAFSITTMLKSKLALVVGSGKNRGALVHVRDVVSAAEFLSTHSRAIGEVYHVTDGTSYTVEEIARSLARACGAIFVPVKIPKWLALRLSRFIRIHRELIEISTVDACLSNEKLRALGFVFEYPDGVIGLAETVLWYKRKR